MIAVWITVLSLPFLANSVPTERQALLFLTAWGTEVNRPAGPQMCVTHKTRKDDDGRGQQITFMQVKKILPRVCDSIRLGSPAEPGHRVKVPSVLVACEWLERSAISFLIGYGAAVKSGKVNAAPTSRAKFGGKSTCNQVDALIPWVCQKAVDNGYRSLARDELFTLRFACNFLASKPSWHQEYSSKVVVPFLKEIANIMERGGDTDHFINNNKMITPDLAKPYVDEIWNMVNSKGHHDAIGTHNIGSIMTACRYLYDYIDHSNPTGK